MDFILNAPAAPLPYTARVQYDDLRDSSKWSIQNGNPPRSPTQRLCKHLREDGLLTNSRMRFDYLTGSVPSLKGRHIDTRKVVHVEIDELQATMGTFELFLMVSGYVEPDAAGHRVTIEETGVFAEDEYQFDGDGLFDTVDWLGNWDVHSLRLLPPPLGCSLGNADFREWRTRTGYGGDFMIYSDLKREPVAPYTFNCP
jgi:hypothetical protein